LIHGIFLSLYGTYILFSLSLHAMIHGILFSLYGNCRVAAIN
jgi:hypothetical protein